MASQASELVERKTLIGRERVSDCARAIELNATT